MHGYLSSFPCLAVIGPRQCGKTTLVNSLPGAWTRIDLERASDRDLVARDPDLFFRLHPGRVVIDEAQLLPELFPALRVAIDSASRRRQPGITSRSLMAHSSGEGCPPM